MARFFVKGRFYVPPKLKVEDPGLVDDMLLRHYSDWVKNVERELRNLRAEHDYAHKTIYNVDDPPEGKNPFALFNTAILWGYDSKTPIQIGRFGVEEAKQDVPRAPSGWEQLVRTVKAGKTSIVFWVNWRERKPIFFRLFSRKKR